MEDAAVFLLALGGLTKVSIIAQTARVTCSLSPIAAMLLKDTLKGRVSLYLGLTCSFCSFKT